MKPRFYPDARAEYVEALAYLEERRQATEKSSRRRCCSLCNASSTSRGVALSSLGIQNMCNLETVYTYEGTHEILTLSIGRALTGLAAFT